MSGVPVAHAMPASRRSSSGCGGMGKGTVWEAQTLPLRHCCLLWPVQSWGCVCGQDMGCWGSRIRSKGCASSSKGSHTSLGLEGRGCQVWEEHGWGLDPLCNGRSHPCGRGLFLSKAGCQARPGGAALAPHARARDTGDGCRAAAQPLAEPRSGCGGAGLTSCPCSCRRAWMASSRSW